MQITFNLLLNHSRIFLSMLRWRYELLVSVREVMFLAKLVRLDSIFNRNPLNWRLTNTNWIHVYSKCIMSISWSKGKTSVINQVTNSTYAEWNCANVCAVYVSVINAWIFTVFSLLSKTISVKINTNNFFFFNFLFWKSVEKSELCNGLKPNFILN